MSHSWTKQTTCITKTKATKTKILRVCKRYVFHCSQDGISIISCRLVEVIYFSALRKFISFLWLPCWPLSLFQEANFRAAILGLRLCVERPNRRNMKSSILIIRLFVTIVFMDFEFLKIFSCFSSVSIRLFCCCWTKRCHTTEAY